MALRRYVIITPCKNEEKSLPEVAKSIINQRIKPLLWIIVDDCSTDNTRYIINKLTDKYKWIQKLELEESKSRDLGIHIAQVYIKGFENAIKYCSINDLKFEYIGIVDADMVLSSTYFERLIEEFEKDKQLGICSGHGYYKLNDRIIWPAFRSDFPTGSARLWRKECFDKTGGYIPTCSPDSVSVAKAKVLGWNTKRIKDNNFFSTRADSSAEGLWKGYKQLASNNYYIGYTLHHALLKGIKLLFSYPYYTGVSYLSSFIVCYLFKKKRLEDNDIIEYYQKVGSERLNEIFAKVIRSK